MRFSYKGDMNEVVLFVFAGSYYLETILTVLFRV